MLKTLSSFSSLYLAALLMMLGSGLFNTYMGLRLTAQSVSAVWVGGLIAAYYLGLVCGARLGHKLIIRVGHIRAFTACAAVVTAMVLLQSLVDYAPAWIGFRLLSGVAMVTQFMVLESWLHEQTENRQRGRVFSFYMLVSNLGVVLGQFALTFYTVLDLRPLIFVALATVLCLVPVAVTRRSHPPSPLPAPLDFKFFASRVPLSLTVLFVAGNLSGAFYGLAPVYAVKVGLSTPDVALFVATGVTAGLCAQFPIGWLSDRVNRAALLRFNALLLCVLPALLWGMFALPFWALIVLSAIFGTLQFTLYPLGAAFANDHVEPERRVGLSAVLLMTYGVGACIGPLMAGALMTWGGPGMYYVFMSACSLILVWRVRPASVTNAHQAPDAPVQFVAMPEVLQSSPAAVALDPRVDLDTDVTMDGIAQPQDADTASVPEDLPTR
jgi:MFS family permease